MNPHYTLANGAYEPTTYELGYIYADLQDIAQAYIDWQQKLGYRMQYEVVESGGLAAAMSYLEPLRRISDAVVFTECENYWVSVLTNRVPSNDVDSIVHTTSRLLNTTGVLISNVPNRYPIASHADSRVNVRGRRRFEVLFQPDNPGDIHTERARRCVEVKREMGSRWRFVHEGLPINFEQEEAYKVARIPDRLSADMLIDYAHAMRINPYDENFYTGRSVAVYRYKPEFEVEENKKFIVPHSFAEARHYFGYVPSDGTAPLEPSDETPAGWDTRSVLERMRSHLPLTVDAVEVMGEDACAVLSGKDWALQVNCSGVLTVAEGSVPKEPQPQDNHFPDSLGQVQGTVITEVSGSEDGYNPVITLRASDGSPWTLTLQAGAVNDPWELFAHGERIAGFSWQDHQAWQAGDLTEG